MTEAREFCRAILRAFPGAEITVREGVNALLAKPQKDGEG